MRATRSTRAFDGEEGQFLGETEPYDAVILDLGLPKVDGVSVLNAWRREGRKMPVIILTARDRWSDKVQGFDAGADDYVTKPFHMEELLARVRALLRRATGHATSEISCGPVRLDTRSGRVVVDGNPVKLTSHEYRLLSYLMHHTGRIVSRGELTEHLYDQDFDRDFEHHRGVHRPPAQEARRRHHPDRARPRLSSRYGPDQDVNGRPISIGSVAQIGSADARLVRSRSLAGRSIAVRLAVSALFWSFAILLIAGLILSALYRDNTERAFDQRLLVYANTLASEPRRAGRSGPGSRAGRRSALRAAALGLVLAGRPARRRGRRYPQLRNPSSAGNCRRSSPPDDQHFGQIRRGYGKAPDDRELRIIERDIDLGEDGRFIIRVAGPADEIDDRRPPLSSSRCIVTFLLLGLALGFTTLLQIRFGLRPLANLRSRARRDPARRGRADRGRVSARHRAARRASSTCSSTPTAKSSSAPARRSAISPMP